jgi:hypothetical protein
MMSMSLLLFVTAEPPAYNFPALLGSIHLTQSEASTSVDPMKRRRGRPRKQPTEKNKTLASVGIAPVVKNSPFESRKLRKGKALELGLKASSPLPMFAHRLSIEEIKEHPQISSWNMHRQVMEYEILDQQHLPIQFQSIKGEYHFQGEKKRAGPKTEEDIVKRVKDNRSENARYHKIKELKLGRGSAVPLFAQRVNIEELNSGQIDEWHQYREKVEKGLMQQEDLPVHLRSRNPGKLIFQDPETARRPPDERQKQIEKVAYQNWTRKEKLKQLQLPKISAMPIFAHGLEIEDINRYEDIDNWHRHRRMMEEGKMTEKDLPEHFKPFRSTLRLHKRPGPSTQQTASSSKG